MSIKEVSSDEVQLSVSREEKAPLSAEETAVQLSARRIFEQFSKVLFAQENRRPIVGAAALTVGSTAMHFLAPITLGKLVESLAHGGSHVQLAGLSLSQTELAALLVISYAFAQLLPMLRDKVSIKIQGNITRALLEQGTRHWFYKSLDFHKQKSVTHMFNLLQRCFMVQNFGVPLLTQMAPLLCEIAIACALLSSHYDILVGGSLFLLSATYVFCGWWTKDTLMKLRNNALKTSNDAFDLIGNRLGRYKLVWDCNHVERTLQEIQSTLGNMRQTDITAASYPIQIGFWQGTLSYAHMLAVVLYVNRGVQEGKYSMQEFISLIGYLSSLAANLPVFGLAVSHVFSSYPDLRFVFSELAVPDEISDPYPNTPLHLSESPAISFDDVCFTYPTRAPTVLDHLSLKIAPGKKVALISRSGAGKTTLFHLLYRHYAPTAGAIYLDGQRIDQVSLDSLQRQICVLGQHPDLFEGTIRDNILFGSPDHPISDEEIMTLAHSVGFDDLPPLDTDVGEGGKKLSGGQQQKVCVLRSLLKKAPIRLLDEATASLDTISATRMLRALLNTADKGTVLMITHKLSEAQFADQIVLLNEGRVIAQGTPTEVAQHPFYQELVRKEHAHTPERTES